MGDISNEMWRKPWSVNVDGVFYRCRAAPGIMIEAWRGGRIINNASTLRRPLGWRLDGVLRASAGVNAKQKCPVFGSGNPRGHGGWSDSL